MGYCLHCRNLFTVSWAGKHCRRLRNNDQNFASLFKPEKNDLYQADIVSELDALVENVGSSRESSEPRSHQLGRVQSCSPSVDFNLPDDLVHGQTEGHVFTSQTHPSDCYTGDSDGKECDDLSEQDFECAEECLLKDSFCVSEFDGEKFLCVADSIMCRLFSGSDKAKKDAFKARVVTPLFKRLSIILFQK